jgi:transposase
MNLTQNITRVSNRLRAVLLRYYPTALHTFQTGLPPVAAQLVLSYPTPADVAGLTWDDFERFARAQGYRRSVQDLRGCYARLQEPQPVADAVAVAAYQGEAQLLAQQYLSLTQSKLAELKAMQAIFIQHPDAALFESLPATGEVIAPGLLAKFGDDRQRFPTLASVQCLAGTCPVTEASGKRRNIHFRRACDHEFRWLTQEWARCSRSQSNWAATYWEQVRPHCDTDNEAYRRLANRWLAVAWKVWQSRQPYDEAYHLEHHARRSKPRV